MIRSFADTATEQVFHHRHSLRYAAFERVALRKLRQIHRVSRVEDLFEAPANHLEAPKSGREGQWSLSLDGSWRMCFEWRNGDAYEVQIVDCH